MTSSYYMEQNPNEATLIPALNIVTAVVVRIKALVGGFQARTLTKEEKQTKTPRFKEVLYR